MNEVSHVYYTGDPVVHYTGDVEGLKVQLMTEVTMPKGVPRRDGSGRGVRANRGRGGCSPTRRVGKR